MSEIRQALTDIYKEHGELKPTVVVTEAAHPESPLHAHFEWDDATASHEYRLNQARRLIRKVRVIEYKGKEETIIHVPSVASHSEGAYKVASVVAKSQSDYDRALDEALSSLDNALRRVAELRKLAPKQDSDRFATASEALSTAKLALVA